MIDKDMPCRKTCPDRTAECKRTCPKWAVWEAKKQATYSARKRMMEGNPVSMGAQKCSSRKKLNALKGRRQ